MVRNCLVCGKKFKVFESKFQDYVNGRIEYICERCNPKYVEKKNKKLKKKKSKEEKEKEKRFKKFEKTEYKRLCKACGKVWHSQKKRELELEEEIKKFRKSIRTAALGQISGNWAAMGASEQVKRNILVLEEKLDQLKSCPECFCHSYTEKEVIY